MPLHLYEINDEIAAILASVDENGELTQEQADKLTAMEMAFDAKVEAVVKFIRSLDAEAKAYKAESDRLADLRRARENRAGWLKNYLADQMRQRNIQKAGTPMGGARIQAGPPRVDITDATLLPAEFLVAQPPLVDKAKALTALKAGETVPGAALVRGEFVKLT